MRLLIVGTGRCGTMSAATALGGIHEPRSDVIVPLAAQYVAGARSADETALILRDTVEWDLMPVAAHYAFVPLLPVLVRMFPTARVLWLWRDRDATVRSMVKRGWYAPRDDDLWPVQTAVWAVASGGRPTLTLSVNHEAFRVTGPLVGDVPWSEWRRWPAERRCYWWVDWVDRVMPAGVSSVNIDAFDPERIAAWAGLPVWFPMPHLNATLAEPGIPTIG